MSVTAQTEKTIFLEAAEIVSPTDQAAFLDRACAGDLQLRDAVDALLLSHQRSQGMLDATSAHLEKPVSESPGTQIGPYKLLQQIGEGGMGLVYIWPSSSSQCGGWWRSRSSSREWTAGRQLPASKPSGKPWP